jgi:hypothetical protein
MSEIQYCVQIGFDLLPLQPGEASKVLQAMKGDKDTIIILSCGVFKKSAINGIREDIWTKQGLPIGPNNIHRTDFNANIAQCIKDSKLLENILTLE